MPNLVKNKKFLDSLNLLLLGLFTILLFRLFLILLPSLPMVKNKQFNHKDSPASKKDISETTLWGKDRTFPPDFTDEEKILLTEQKHDYERTNANLEADYQKYLDIRDSLPVRSSTITIIKYKDDCFVRPVIIKVWPDQKLLIKNPNDTSVNLGMNGLLWDIPANQDLLVTLKLKETQTNQIYWGYSCSQYGLAGYFVLDQ
jgi:hypothetical protein